MAKIYLIDSENVGDSWIQLLPSVLGEDKLFVFYTDKSPYISYESLLQVIAYGSIPSFIKCHEGRNALDFQLVTELGYKIAQMPEGEFVIVSDDNGFDAVIRYWSDRQFKIRRIGRKFCRSIPTQRKWGWNNERVRDMAPASEQSADTVSTDTMQEEPLPVVYEAYRSPQESPLQEKAENEWVEDTSEYDAEGTADTMEDGDVSANAYGSAADGADADTVNGNPPETEHLMSDVDIAPPMIPQDSGNASIAPTPNEPAMAATLPPALSSSAEDAAVSNDIPAATQAVVGELHAAEVPSTDTTTGQAPAAIPKTTSRKNTQTRKNTRSGKTTEDKKAAAPAAAEPQKESVTEAPVETVETKTSAPTSLRELIDKIVLDCKSPQPEKDAKCVYELFYSLSMATLTEVNTALKILIGNEAGNSIYRELKEHQEFRQALDDLYLPAQKDRFLHYVGLVLERSDLQDMTTEEMGKFLLRIPRKNLNSIRSSMQKEFGHDQGSKVYTVYKPHIKVLNKI